jgi:hypothetical protein
MTEAELINSTLKINGKKLKRFVKESKPRTAGAGGGSYRVRSRMNFQQEGMIHNIEQSV